MPAETCQNAETPICNELHNPLSISNDAQIVDPQRGTQNLVSVRTCRFESDHRHQPAWGRFAPQICIGCIRF